MYLWGNGIRLWTYSYFLINKNETFIFNSILAYDF